MKKIIYLLIFFSSIMSQDFDLRDRGLAPERSTLKKQKLNNDRNTPGIIILDEKNSILKWKGGLKFGENDHEGTLKIRLGRVAFREEDKNFSRGRIQIDMRTMICTDLEPAKGERLVGHLRSADFFDVDHFPIANLDIKKSELIGKTPSGLYQIRITGDLTIKSIKKPIMFNAEADLDSEIKKATGTIVFNRTDFGIEYRSEQHLNNPDLFWNKLRSMKEAVKDRVIRDEIEVEFEMLSTAGMLRK